MAFRNIGSGIHALTGVHGSTVILVPGRPETAEAAMAAVIESAARAESRGAWRQVSAKRRCLVRLFSESSFLRQTVTRVRRSNSPLGASHRSLDPAGPCDSCASCNKRESHSLHSGAFRAKSYVLADSSRAKLDALADSPKSHRPGASILQGLVAMGLIANPRWLRIAKGFHSKERRTASGVS